MSAVRETIADFRKLNTEPFGLNHGDADSHLRFRSSLNLPFDLLVDEDLAVSHKYGALKLDPDNPGAYLESINRTVIVVGLDGKIIYRRAGSPPPAEILDAIRDASDSTL